MAIPTLGANAAPVAICGMAMRLPGGVHTDKSLWDVLVEGKDMRAPIPAGRWNAAGFGDFLGKKGAIKTEHGYFLQEDLWVLDSSFFSMAKSDLEKMDPQQRKILEVTRECLESAGEIGWRGKEIGCFVGTFGDDWMLQQAADRTQFTGNFSGMGDLMIANRISYEFDFRGPSEVVKTGCSASLVALHNAVRSVQNGDCEAAIVAGTSLIMGPYLTAGMTRHGVLSPEGSCKTFDAAADGFARADAINALFIKKVEYAVRDGNPIRAVIRGTATNSDGHSASITAPSGEAHQALMRKVYAEAGLDPADTGYVECHGTGTPIGDPIETKAVGAVFSPHGVHIGSIKPNFGHGEGASGINSVMKAVLCLENKTIPPQIKFINPNPSIPFAEKKLHVAIEPTPWPQDRALRVSVNSFGIGGTNAHVIIDSPEQLWPQQFPYMNGVAKEKPHLMLFSANSVQSLETLADNIRACLDAEPNRSKDVAYTLAMRREHLLHRSYFIENGSSPSPVPVVRPPGDRRPVAFVFSGQGAQWPTMGRRLIEADNVFRTDIEAMDAVLQSLKRAPKWTIVEELGKCATESRVHTAEFAQPLCTAIQIGLVNLFRRCGIAPTAVVGHSSGEIAAAYAAGTLTMTEAIICAYYRGYVSALGTIKGGMAAVGFGAEHVSPFIRPGVIVACENSPDSTTISGDIETLKEVLTLIRERSPDVLARELKVDMAYHSHHMEALATTYLELMKDELADRALGRSDASVPLFSSVTEAAMTSGAGLGPAYWAANLTSPVKFSAAVSKLIHYQPGTIFLEIGPHSTLSGPLRAICKQENTSCEYITSMRRGDNCYESFLSALGSLYQQGIDIHLKALTPHAKVLHDLPAYPWNHSQNIWYESRVYRDWRLRAYGHHSLLGERIPESTDNNPQWRVLLELEDEPWLAHHKIQNDIVFPFCGYVCMAGEAVRQLTSVETGYSVQHLVVHTALILKESFPTEIITSVRRQKLTDTKDSSAYEFSVSSYSGSTWIKHTDGLVRAIEERISATEEITMLPRHVSSRKWYEMLARVGYLYGPEFQGISRLTASTTEHVSEGIISSTETQRDGPFLFHPASMDASLQLMMAAISQAASRNLDQLAVPTMVDQLDVFKMTANMHARAWGSTDGKDGGVECVAGGYVVLRLRRARLTPLEVENAAVEADRHAAALLKWYPDFDFMDKSRLFSPPTTSNRAKLILEELTLLCLLETHEKLAGLTAGKIHFLKFRDWIAREKSRAESGDDPVVPNPMDYARLSPDVRRRKIIEKYAELPTTESISVVGTGIMRICDNAEDLFTGQVDPLELLMKEHVLTELYNAVSFGFGPFVRMLSISKPTLRILEVGAGTGGTTELLLRGLARHTGNPSYTLYTFTDISAGFFVQARERFSHAPNMEYKVFDISMDPFEQGFEAQSYDLILAPNVIHATPRVGDTLRNLQPLLKADGHLVLCEICPDTRATPYVFGNFSGWWLGAEDGREWEPYVMPERWDRELKAAGFTGIDTIVYDAERPFQYTATIVTSPRVDPATTVQDDSVLILAMNAAEGIAKQFIDELKDFGMEVKVASLGESLDTDRDIISVLDLETPFFENVSEEKYFSFLELVRLLEQRTLLWLMPPSQMHCVDPRSAQTVGMLRVARAELNGAICSLEIDTVEPNFTALVAKVFGKVRSSANTGNLMPDREYAVHNGIINIGRYQPFSVADELAVGGPQEPGSVKSLEITKPGLLDTLRWVDSSPILELGVDQVEVATRAVGLNFRDILVTMGLLKQKKVPAPGLEASGVVMRIGPGVKNIKVGDRVCAIATSGCFTTSLVLSESCVIKIPDSLDFVAAASIPAVYTTVVYSLFDIGHLQKGQSILVHSAAGGVGHAAIEVAKMIGARVFATVGSAEKRRYLQEKLGISPDHIFNSRDDSFYADIMRATDGNGVDLVLNSLSGELLHASWKCVGEFGKLVELGKRDALGFGKLDMEPFLLNRSYCCVDLAHWLEARPTEARPVMQRWIDLLEEGKIQGMYSISVFEPAELMNAFRHMQQGDNIGKTVVKMPEHSGIIQSVPRAPDFDFDPEYSYLLTGGLGGIGRSVASWMAEKGARSLIFLSRSAGQNESDQQYLASIQSMGCQTTVISGRADNKADMEEVLLQAPKPIRGVLHFAMVLRDAPLLDLTYEDWNAAVKPKVDGAWTIHEVFQAAKVHLDFFVVSSSLTAVVGQPGQANYSAANTFLEAFTQFRHRQGLAASALAICPIEDVGFISENPVVRRKLKSQCLHFLHETELLECVQLAILRSRPQLPTEEPTVEETLGWASPSHIVMGLHSETHMDEPSCQTSWRHDRRMGMYHNVPRNVTTGGSADRGDRLRAFVSCCADDKSLLAQEESQDFLAEEIGRRIFKFLLKPEDDVQLSMSLAQIGMDSLVAIELRRWWKQSFGLDVSVLEITSSGSLRQLGKLAAAGLAAKFGDEDLRSR